MCGGQHYDFNCPHLPKGTKKAKIAHINVLTLRFCPTCLANFKKTLNVTERDYDPHGELILDYSPAKHGYEVHPLDCPKHEIPNPKLNYYGGYFDGRKPYAICRKCGAVVQLDEHLNPIEEVLIIKSEMINQIPIFKELQEVGV